MKITDEIEISAPAAVVWAIQTDADRLAEWLPGFKSSARSDGGGPFVAGSRARIKQTGLPATEWTAQEVDDDLHRFVWSTKVLGMSLVATHVGHAVHDRWTGGEPARGRRVGRPGQRARHPS